MKKLVVFMLTLIVALMAVSFVEANEEVAEGVDIMIIIDKSASMGWNDPNRETLEAVYQLLNLNLGTHNRVGFVVYNDTIITHQELKTIETIDQIDGIMNELRGFQVSRWTDAGLALQTARSLLDRDDYRQGTTAIVYLSDGVSRFVMEGNPNRNHSDVIEDVEDVLTNISYPIFMVEYSVLAVNNQQFGVEWAERTGGVHFNASTPDEMTEAVTDIYQFILNMAEGSLPPIEVEQVREHQLTISIPNTETERAGVVEVTVMGHGLIDEIIVPADYEHIRVSRVGEDHVITITDPVNESYTLHYLARSARPLETNTMTQMVDVETGGTMPLWILVGIIVSIVIALIILVLLLLRIRKQRMISKLYPTLNGSLECYFMEIPTGVKPIPIKSWSASFLAANNKTSLDKLLKNVLLVRKMPAAGKIFVAINIDCTISIINKAGIICFKDGKQVVEEDIILRNGEGLYMVFQKNTIEVELRAKLR